MRKFAAMIAVLALVLSSGSAIAQSASGGTAGQKTPAPAAGHTDMKATSASSMADDMRSMYISMGAMGGYMVYVMPITVGAIAAAVGAGVVTAWAYDYAKEQLR